MAVSPYRVTPARIGNSTCLRLPAAFYRDHPQFAHERDRQGGDAADVPGQAAQVVVGKVGNQPQPGVQGRSSGGGQQQQLDAHQHGK